MTIWKKFLRDLFDLRGSIADRDLSKECISVRKFVETVNNTTAIEVLSFDSFNEYTLNIIYIYIYIGIGIPSIV